MMIPNGKRIAVVALGDLARSPRMLNHARSLARRGYQVSLVGYREKPLDLPGEIQVIALDPGRRAEEGASKLAFLWRSALRMGGLLVQLVRRLLDEKPDTILLQNAPAFPTLLAAWIAARIRHARVIVDWHNYAYTVLALRLSASHPIVRLAAWYELTVGRWCDGHLCVSRALREDLRRRRILATVLYDRPVEFIEAVEERDPDTLIAVCPCSWTADDDIALLLDALEQLPPTRRRLEVHLTGDGPLRAGFDARIEALRARVDVRTGYLTDPNYRALLRRADIGLSPHRSSSGLDLAMKVADLYAARVPVCALNYGGSLPEQVINRFTGYLFDTAQELSAILAKLLDDPAPLATMRANIAIEWRETWDEAWEFAWR